MIRNKEFEGFTQKGCYKKALEWINQNNIKVICMYETRYFWYFGSIQVIYKDNATGGTSDN